MFIIDLHYKKTLDDVNRRLPEHVAYLDRFYSAGNFICSGPKTPRNGGIIFSLCDSLVDVKKIIAEDPFYKEQIADYTITEFTPTKSIDKFPYV